MSKWEYLIGDGGDKLRQIQAEYSSHRSPITEARLTWALTEADDKLRDAERVFDAADTPAHRAAYVRLLRRAGEDEKADYLESVGLIEAAVERQRWSKPSDDEISRVARHFTLADIRQLLASRTPNRVNVMLDHSHFYHLQLTTADGSRQTWRASGKLKTWKTRPDEFRIPIKWGLGRRSDHNSYLTHLNANQFSLDEE